MPFFKSRPAPAGFGEGKTLPEGSAWPWSRLVFSWLDPLLKVGFSRPLQENDLWSLPDKLTTGSIADRLEYNFYVRCPPEQRPLVVREHNPALASGVPAAQGKERDEKTLAEVSSAPAEAKEGDKQPEKSPYDESLIKAIHRTVLLRWWLGGLFKVLGDTLRTTSPLIQKVMLGWLAEAYLFDHLDADGRSTYFPNGAPRGIGYGIGLAFALFAMQEVASLFNNHYQQLVKSVGLITRTGVIGMILRKALRLSGKSRQEHNVGQITTMISTDTERLYEFCLYAHEAWVAPIQVAIGIGLLIHFLGVSALVGLGVLIFGLPFQMIMVAVLFAQRKKGVGITDGRVRLTSEVLHGIRLVKAYVLEEFYMNKITDFRRRELATIRRASIAQALLFASVHVVPVAAAILSFVTYSLTGHDLNVAIIFSSLSLFNIIQTPLLLMPLALGGLATALVATGRLSKFYLAEELDDPYLIDTDRKNAVDVDGDFTWESTAEEGKAAEAKPDEKAGKLDEKAGKPDEAADKSLAGEKSKEQEAKDEKPAEPVFQLDNLRMSVPKGAFVAIVGPIGSGKSSILQALIGEMRRTRGEVVFGGSVAYVPQKPWIQSTTVRQNIAFGLEENESRLRAAIRACSLDHDIERLPMGERTEIGENGVTLSGGQKARISLARAVYSNADVILLDDVFSAVDSYVGRKLLDECVAGGALADRTRVLVTHALYVLDRADYVYVVDGGKIVEQGTYQDLMSQGQTFARLVEEYGVKNEDAAVTKVEDRSETATVVDVKAVDAPQQALMQDEERAVGSVSWRVYQKYIRYAGGLTWVPAIIIITALGQCSQVANTLFLSFWSSQSIAGFSNSTYMLVYGMLGVAQAFFSFLLNFAVALVCLFASLRIFRAALRSVLRSSVAFFDTTPMGRIMSRLSKDQDTLDVALATSLAVLLSLFGNLLGTVGLVFYIFPYLGIIFAPLGVLYYVVALYYRKSSVETKRLDAILRSSLYASYTEALTGLPTIRAYASQDRFITRSEQGQDRQNKATYVSISIQAWLTVRLDLFGNILILGTALFAAGFRKSVEPAKIGAIISYCLPITTTLDQIVTQYAELEQNMNAVERILNYSELPAEAPPTTPEDPPADWPSQGRIEFKDVEMAYRPGLPLVLKGVSFTIEPGEKVGIVGRTGAGKSTVIQALFRMTELRSGSIEVDGYDTSKIGLDILRSRMALVPQDSTLFLGTLRENLDPTGTRTDAELLSALHSVHLVHEGNADDPKFSLDAAIADEGSNYSAGEKQLLALCRALVKQSKVIALDEATANVDVDTDAKLQRTIRTEFKSRTLLCIAHRLNTIAYYDKIIVMDDGRVAEVGSVLSLFDTEGSIFRSLCNEAKLSRADIERIRGQEPG
ncbi:P-loop containing nucleoside triphosphate hydrolase protein [Schizophyllum commune Tattone D]|nr:P-loop containing nucleoside triphosphate hydrolase protein [Schizophyllum commune Tattone D]